MPRYAQPVPTQPARKGATPAGVARPQPHSGGPQRSALWHAIQLKAAQTAAAAPDAPSRSGLPGALKTGVETLSGLAMDDVRVHRNSPEPAKLGALAYAQGSDIHLGPGQEAHLPHEAWHVVQQKQGRVRPTMQMKGLALNDSVVLEREADRMGERAARLADPAAAAPTAADRRPAAAGNVVQAKIKFKDQTLWDSQTQLPPGIAGTEVHEQVKSAELYLAQKTDDMVKRATRKSAPLLSPHRHIIGEEHHKSKFETAAKDWGWGADKMLESYQESALVPDRLAAANRQVAGWTLGVKSLENFHAYMLTGFGVLKAYLYRLGAQTESSAGYAKNVRDGAGGAAQPFKTSEETADKHRKSARDEWKGILLHLPSYKEAWLQKRQQLAELDFMEHLWTTATTTLTEITDKPYNVFTSWANTTTALEAKVPQIQAFITDIVDKWGAALIKLAAADVAAAMPADEQAPEALRETGLTASWNQALQNPWEKLSPVREFFMIELINSKLTVPGIVGVGQAHLKALKNKIDSGRIHESHEQFTKSISETAILELGAHVH